MCSAMKMSTCVGEAVRVGSWNRLQLTITLTLSQRSQADKG